MQDRYQNKITKSTEGNLSYKSIRKFYMCRNVNIFKIANNNYITRRSYILGRTTIKLLQNGWLF